MREESPLWRAHPDTKVSLLVDGRDYYRAFYEAVLQARRSILLLGWQFDSDVELLRGDDLPADLTPRDVELLALLGRLCRERPELEIRLLAWDHSLVFALEREMLQKAYFDALACERFVFRWDATVPLGGSHHQKVAIIDGKVAFLGSQDVCQCRWDDSRHVIDNPLRVSRGEPHQPYHEVQAALEGPAARSLLELFVTRWEGATGEALDADALAADNRSAIAFPATLVLPPAPVGLARTVPAFDARPPVQEVASVLTRAIERAERLVYIETQYLTSHAVRDALVARMRDATRPKLDVAVFLPDKPEKLKEELTVGVAQAQLLAVVAREAKDGGHAFGAYNALAGAGADGEPRYVYVHSKLMIVDDELFVVGSANFTNRSMTIDSEIVAVYDASGDARARRAVRRTRARLLAEHVGLLGDGADVPLRALVRPEGLVGRLEALVDAGRGRLRRHDIRDEEPNVLARAIHDLTADLLDPHGVGEPIADSRTL